MGGPLSSPNQTSGLKGGPDFCLLVSHSNDNANSEEMIEI